MESWKRHKKDKTKGVKAITGIKEIKVGDWENYDVSQWHEGTPQEKRNEAHVKWELYHLKDGKTPVLVLEKEIGHFRFQQKAVGEKFLISAHVYEADLKSSSTMEITVVSAEEPKILGIDVTDYYDKPITKKLAYGNIINVHVRTAGMVGHHMNITLWEDDVDGAGHSDKNTKIVKYDKPAKVGSKCIAHAQFVMSRDYAKKALKNEGKDDETHEYYVTAYALGELKASKNVNFVYPKERIAETKDKLEGKAKPKEVIPPVKKKIPVQPVGTPRAPAIPRVPHTPAAKKGITSVTLTKKGTEQVVTTIYSTGLVGKNIRFKLMEDDGGSLVDDELQNKIFPITGDTMTLVTNLKAIPKSWGDDSTVAFGKVIYEDNIQELFVDIEVLETHAHFESKTINVDSKAFKIDVDDANKVVKLEDSKVKKEKFDKVKEFAEEAVIYVTSIISSEIKVDEKGKLESYPDQGGFNGQNEYVEDKKIYCKKINKNSSAFPTYKAYIYRGNVVGEAIKKLKQDISNKTFENAESTVLEIARHALANNKNYLSGGPVPPNDLKNLYELKYQYGVSKERPSYRYRIVDNRNKNKANFPDLKDYTKEDTNGTMSLGSRGSISIDPWKSKGLIGCIGIRGTNGVNHPSCDSRMGDWNDKVKYKFIYHSLNNYLETVVPEITGIYGRRGYSSAGEVAVSASQYKEQIKVYVLVDSLPEISNCKCDLKKDGREEFYNEFGDSAIKMVEGIGKSNKFKGLYMVAQRRQENSFKLKVPNNNPMNIKGKGDLGQSDLYTTEYINGKAVKMNDGFANFSTVEKGFEGYLNLLDKNFNDAYNSIIDDSKTIDDFLNGMQDNGRLGAYATDPNYKTSIKVIYNGVVSDYKKIYECKLCKAKTEEDKNKLKLDIELLNKLK